MTDPRPNNRLRALLRTGDPAADGMSPTEEERTWLRRLVLNRVPDHDRTWRWLPITTAVAAMLLAVVLLTGPEETPRRSDLGASSQPEAVSGGTADDSPGQHRQQVQFATENGTRIIWVLDPDLTL